MPLPYARQGAALARQSFARAREVVLWGTGPPRREFMHVDDLASALVFLMERYDAAHHINVGVEDPGPLPASGEREPWSGRGPVLVRLGELGLGDLADG